MFPRNWWSKFVNLIYILIFHPESDICVPRCILCWNLSTLKDRGRKLYLVQLEENLRPNREVRKHDNILELRIIYTQLVMHGSCTANCTLVKSCSYRCVKSVRIRSYSGPYFPAFELKTERYSVFLRIQSECGEMRTRITPNTDIFHAVIYLRNSFSLRDLVGINFSQSNNIVYRKMYNPIEKGIDQE